MSRNILNINNLTVTVDDGREKKLVNDVSFGVPELSITALVGGSGSGKTTTGLSILRLLSPALKIAQGEIVFKGENLLALPEQDMRRLRGKEISMVFQEPLNAFNPVFTIGYQIDEVLRQHTTLTAAGRQKKILDLLDVVGMADPSRIMNTYPHQLSGGMRQRAMIAQALAVDPALIIADEPTSNLDVTLQARIIELFKKLRDELSLSILLITHDLGMVAHLADDVVVLAEGKVVESGKTKEVMENPQDPYTQKLMDALLV